MEDVSKEYSLEMILNHEPTEAGRKNRELGIDGQCFGFFCQIFARWSACAAWDWKASACIYSFQLIDRRVVSSLVNMHVRVQVDSFCLNPFSPNQNDAVSLIISGKQVQDFYILCHLTFI